MKRAILAGIGTDGDVYPFLALGTELRKRGYRATLATHEHFAGRARDADMDFAPLVSDQETRALWEQRDFWHPFRSGLVVARWGGRLIGSQYRVLKQLASRDDPFFVASPGVIAARVVQEDIKTPLVSVVLQPGVISSIESPPAMMGGLTLPRWAPRPIGRLYFKLIDALGARLLGRDFRRLRASLGLPPIPNMFRWWFSPELALGLFPEWFGPKQIDWPPQIRLVGFPANGPATRGLPENLRSFCHQRQPVIAVTFGTGMMHATELFRETLEGCRLAGARAVLLTRFRAQLPDELPPFALHCEFASFEELFPWCAAVVHHGGIGTVASAIASAIPQLIFPFAFDQLDNAVRVKRLGAGVWLKARQRNAREIASALTALVNSEARASARRLAGRPDARSGIGCAADEIESFARLAENTPRVDRQSGAG